MLIEKAIPIPSMRGAPAKCPYPFAQMEIGDSFLIPATAEQTPARIRACIGGYARRFAEDFAGFCVTTRVVEGGVRCWRTEQMPRRKRNQSTLGEIANLPPAIVATVPSRVHAADPPPRVHLGRKY